MAASILPTRSEPFATSWLVAAEGIKRAVIARLGAATPRSVRALGASLEIDGRVPVEALYVALDDAARASGDPAFGLALGLQLELGTFELIDFAGRAAPDVGAALATAARYYRVISNRAAVRFLDDGSPRLTAAPAMDRELSRVAVECLLGVVVRRTAALTGGRPIVSAVAFAHRAPTDSARHRSLLGPDVALAFDAPESAIVFAASAMRIALPTSDPPLFAFVTREADRMLASVDDHEPAGARLRRLMLSGAPIATLERAARLFAMSARSLQRRLAEEGDSYEKVVDDVRLQRALASLRDPRKSCEQVALELGFQSAAGFTRAFRRWYGAPPSAYRRRALASPIG